MAGPGRPEFDLQGVHHVVLVCRDMAETVRFYRDVLGLRLLKTIDLPNEAGQHFFFDIGNGDCLAFFWFPNAPAAAPGTAAPAALPGQGPFTSAHGSLNHLAFKVPLESFESCYARLKSEGVAVSAILNHDDSPAQVSPSVTPAVFVRSFYFFDPDGVCLEFAAWTRDFTAADVAHEPRGADGARVHGLIEVGRSSKSGLEIEARPPL